MFEISRTLNAALLNNEVIFLSLFLGSIWGFFSFFMFVKNSVKSYESKIWLF